MHDTVSIVFKLVPHSDRQLVGPYTWAAVSLMAEGIGHLIPFPVHVQQLDVFETAEQPDNLIVHWPGYPCVRRLASKQPKKGKVVALDNQPTDPVLQGKVKPADERPCLDLAHPCVGRSLAERQLGAAFAVPDDSSNASTARAVVVHRSVEI